ncbi:bromodomain and PHD finger-containing protein [Histoplasma ohiense]
MRVDILISLFERDFRLCSVEGSHRNMLFMGGSSMRRAPGIGRIRIISIAPVWVPILLMSSY